MTFWIIAAPALVAVGWLVWWSSGRAKPDLRARPAEASLLVPEESPRRHLLTPEKRRGVTSPEEVTPRGPGGVRN
ncbi:MAG TPA: hypothetical protein VF416_08955 [Marmoricola sp.]